jgi:hypothetical protein
MTQLRQGWIWLLAVGIGGLLLIAMGGFRPGAGPLTGTGVAGFALTERQ